MMSFSGDINVIYNVVSYPIWKQINLGKPVYDGHRMGWSFMC